MPYRVNPVSSGYIGAGQVLRGTLNIAELLQALQGKPWGSFSEHEIHQKRNKKAATDCIVGMLLISVVFNATKIKGFP